MSNTCAKRKASFRSNTAASFMPRRSEPRAKPPSTFATSPKPSLRRMLTLHAEGALRNTSASLRLLLQRMRERTRRISLARRGPRKAWGRSGEKGKRIFGGRMRWILAVWLCLVSTAALAQESWVHADFRRESERVHDACTFHNFMSVGGCAYTLFTDHPLHIAAGSMPPQNSFGLGLAYVATRNTENWRLSWDMDAVGATSG